MLPVPPLAPERTPCPRCRLVFCSAWELRRHQRLDHTPAPDGALVTALLVEPRRPPARESDPAPVHRPAVPHLTAVPCRALVVLATCWWVALLLVLVLAR